MNKSFVELMRGSGTPPKEKAPLAATSEAFCKEQKNPTPIVADAQKIGNTEFMRAIFPDLADDEYCWTTSFFASPNSDNAQWGGKAALPTECLDSPTLNAYFSVSALKASDGAKRRRLSHFSRLFCVVLDDSNGADITPTWRLSTSHGKAQVGYRLSIPESDVEVAKRLHDALSKSGMIPADKNGNNPVRYVRLPVGLNTKYTPAHTCRLIEWNPETSYTLDEIIEALGFDIDLIRESKPTKVAEHAGRLSDGAYQDDAELIRQVVSAENYHDPLLKLSARYATRGMKEDEIIEIIKGLMRVFNDGSDRWNNRFKDIPRMVKEGVKKFGPQDDPMAEALLHHPTQDNVALIFRKNLSGHLLYAHSFGTWLEWDGTRWKRERTGKVFDYTRALVRKVNREGKASISSAAFCNGVEAYLRTDRAFAVEGTEFDADNYLLNTPGGTFDLRSNTLQPHNPADRMTLRTTVTPCADGGDRFRQFLREISGEDEQLMHFLKVSLGACLSGATESHWLLFWTGSGRNGKNTLGDLVMYVAGDYARKIPASTLMAKSHEGHPTELASLKGIRIATSSEVSDGDHWHEARINELTGDAMISARFMRGDFFEFPRTHKHLIYGNHRPQLRSVTEAIKARIKIVPFKQSFIGKENPLLPEELRSEAPYVLHWLLEGHAEWLRGGRKLPACSAVSQESDSYFSDQSTVDMWISERLCIMERDDRPAYLCPKSGELYQDYSSWKKARGEVPVSQTRWAEPMRRFTRITSNGVRYRGVRCDDDFFDLV